MKCHRNENTVIHILVRMMFVQFIKSNLPMQIFVADNRLVTEDYDEGFMASNDGYGSR